MIVREPLEFSYLREQEQVEANDQAMIDQTISPVDHDIIQLRRMVDEHGMKRVLAALQDIQSELKPGTQLTYRILSQAYLSGGYDDPNPCSCDDGW
ncbi:MAG TPA: hypothetical protein V6D07_07650 [Trichocoleus sp.]